MTWARAIRRELGSAVTMAVAVALLVLGFLAGAGVYRQITIEQGQRLEDAAARHCIYLQPHAPRQYP